MTRAWVEAALNNTEPPQTGLDGLRVIEAALAAYESSRLEKRIILREIKTATDQQDGGGAPL